ncbi:MAG: hypothetical protein HY459_01775 [Parcubacteria group bacterium]|nr:hypothetical protein [Parcubacteria group bacterium]
MSFFDWILPLLIGGVVALLFWRGRELAPWVLLAFAPSFLPRQPVEWAILISAVGFFVLAVTAHRAFRRGDGFRAVLATLLGVGSIVAIIWFVVPLVVPGDLRELIAQPAAQSAGPLSGLGRRAVPLQEPETWLEGLVRPVRRAIDPFRPGLRFLLGQWDVATDFATPIVAAFALLAIVSFLHTQHCWEVGKRRRLEARIRRKVEAELRAEHERAVGNGPRPLLHTEARRVATK